MVDSSAWKLRDAELYSELPPRFADYVGRVSGRIVGEICRLARLRAGERVLDVGSGTGTATVAVARRVTPGGSAVGIDYSRERCDHARASIPSGLAIEYEFMDAEDLRFERASFDAVVSYSAIFHFPHPERALREMARVLAADGRLVLTYHATRPNTWPARVAGSAMAAVRALAPPFGPVLRAPDCLQSSAETYLAKLETPAVAEWSRSGAGDKIHGWLDAVGLTVEEETWAGEEVAWDDPDEFYEAQMMIHAELRARASRSSPEARQALRLEFTQQAAQVLRRGGRLLYPFGAVCIRAARS